MIYRDLYRDYGIMIVKLSGIGGFVNSLKLNKN